MIRRKKKNNQKLQFNAEKVFLAATQPVKLAYSYFQTTKYGLTDDEVKVRQQLYGKNEVIHEQKKRPIIVFCKAFINPFIGVLTALVVISLVIDVWMAEPGEQE